MFNRRMAQRLAAAEAERDAALESLRVALEYQQNTTHLVSIVRDKRKVRLLFSRNNELTQIEAYITLDHDWNEIERRLISHG
jgi:hypothetical protein